MMPVVSRSAWMCISPVFRLAVLRVSAWVMMAMRASSFPSRSETASGYAFPAYSPWSADWLVVQKLGPIRGYWMTPLCRMVPSAIC